jgi:hypothetical protein
MVWVVDNCGIPLVLYLVQNLLSFVLPLCSLLYLLSMRYIEVPDYTARYCTKAMMCYTMAVCYYMVVAQYYTAAAQCCMELELD